MAAFQNTFSRNQLCVRPNTGRLPSSPRRTEQVTASARQTVTCTPTHNQSIGDSTACWWPVQGSDKEVQLGGSFEIINYHSMYSPPPPSFLQYKFTLAIFLLSTHLLQATNRERLDLSLELARPGFPRVWTVSIPHLPKYPRFTGIDGTSAG